MSVQTKWMLVPSCMSWPSEKENKTVDKPCIIAVTVHMNTLPNYRMLLRTVFVCRIRMPYPYANPYACERHFARQWNNADHA